MQKERNLHKQNIRSQVVHNVAEGFIQRQNESHKLFDTPTVESLYTARFLERYLSVTTGISLREVIQTTIGFLSKELKLTCCSVSVLDSNGAGFRLYASHHVDIACQKGGDYLPADSCALSSALINSTPRYRPDISAEANFEFDKVLLEHGLLSDFFVPLWVSGRCLGTLNIGSDQLDAFNERERYLVSMLAPTLAQSLENSHLFEALCEREKTLDALMKNSPDYIMLLNLKFEIQFLNRVLPNMNFPDTHVEQLRGKSIFDYFSEKSHASAHTCFERVLRKRNAGRFEIECVLDKEKDYVQSKFYEANVGSVVENESVIGLIVSVRDITRRKRAEESLRQTAVVVDNTAEAVIVTDIHNNIIRVNAAFTDITGYTIEEILGKTPSVLKSERHDKAFYTDMWRSITQTGHWQGEIWDRRKNGEIFPAWQTISTVYDSDGRKSNYVSVFSDISTLKQSQAKLDFLAYHDPLTNLPNRLLFEDRLEHALQRAQRDEQQVAVLFLDLDRFKQINDTLGHPIGDRLIQSAAARLTSIVREEDTVARLGGDEFIIAMENIREVQDVIVLSEKLINAFNEPFLINTHELHVSISMGISLYPQDGRDSESLVKNADIAMYRVKEEGRNNYHFFTPELSTCVFERLTMETALRHALERGELLLHYQSQHSLKTGELQGAEALVRWQHPEMGLVYPSKFIALAEDCGLIVALGEWVLREACLQAQAWRQAGFVLPQISVNVSALQLQRGDFVNAVEKVLHETGLPAPCLELEITESVIMKKAEWAIEILDYLKTLGVRLAIDDFGTGYSSLSYLKRLPVNKLKIDRSFIRDIPQDTNDKAIARAIVALGQSLGLIVIAEGVETEEQRVFLNSLGCDEGQGAFFRSAMTPEAFKGTLKQDSALTSSLEG